MSGGVPSPDERGIIRIMIPGIEGQRVCPRCVKHLPNGAMFCRRCGTALGAPAVAPLMPLGSGGYSGKTAGLYQPQQGYFPRAGNRPFAARSTSHLMRRAMTALFILGAILFWGALTAVHLARTAAPFPAIRQAPFPMTQMPMTPAPYTQFPSRVNMPPYVPPRSQYNPPRNDGTWRDRTDPRANDSHPVDRNYFAPSNAGPNRGGN
jgi:hypothetical protein